jgi:RimJ/RimL family protein N-acetyltransferase
MAANDQADPVHIREAKTRDAGALLGLKSALDSETSLMLLERGERTTTETEVAEQLEAIAGRSNSVVFVAEIAGELIGYAEATGGDFRRNHHTAHVVIGVRKRYSGRGIGGHLLSELECWAQANSVRRLELTVMTSNERAIGLYRKLGYRVEGKREAALLVQDRLVDEFWMAKLLGGHSP